MKVACECGWEGEERELRGFSHIRACASCAKPFSQIRWSLDAEHQMVAVHWTDDVYFEDMRPT